MQPEERKPGLRSTLLRAGMVLGTVVGGLVGLLSVLNALRGRRKRWDGGQGPATSGEQATDHTHYALRTTQVVPEQSKLEPGWSVPRPAELPRPTYWPAVLALGIVLLVWGLVSSLVISGVGLALFAVGLSGWIGELRHAQ